MPARVYSEVIITKRGYSYATEPVPGSGDDTLSYTFVLQNDLVQSLTLPDGTKLIYNYKDCAISLVNEDIKT